MNRFPDSVFLSRALTHVLTWTLTSFVLATPSFAKEGGTSSGGGMGIFRKDGSIELVELATPLTHAPALVDSPSQVDRLRASLAGKKRFLKTIANESADFLQCGAERLRSWIPASQKSRLEQLAKTKVLLVNFRLVPVTETPESAPVPVFANVSARMKPEIQIALAAFQSNEIWVDAQAYDRMNDEQRCGLGVHELARAFNGSGSLNVPLSTAEIEALTAAAMNRGDTADSERAFAKIGDLGFRHDKIFAEIERVEAELAAIPSTFSTDVPADVKLKASVALQEYRDLHQRKIADEDFDFTQFADHLLKISSRLFDASIAHYDRLPESSRKAIHEASDSMLNLSQTALTVSVGTWLKTMAPYVGGGRLGIMDSAFVHVGLTEKLGAFKWFDTRTVKVVTRALP